MTRSGLSSPIFFSAAEPLLTAITSYPASARILRPMFWAVTLSSASSIFLAKEIPLMRGDIAKVTCPSAQVNDQTGGYLVTSGQRLPRSEARGPRSLNHEGH